MSNLLDAAIKKLYQYVDTRVEETRSFRAIVTGTSSGMVQIRRIHSPSEETALRARCVGFDLAVSDEVLCAPMADGIPVVVAKLQRAAPSGSFTLPVSLQVGGSSGATIRSGSGSPEGAVTGSVGDLYLRTNGAAGTILYEKATGSGNTGWSANAGTSGDWQFGTVMRSMAPYNDEVGVAVNIAHSLTHGYQDEGNTKDIALDVNSPGSWAVYNTAASTNDDAGWDLGGTNPFVVHTNWYPMSLEWRYQSGATLTNGRWWIGCFSATPETSDDPAVSGFGFRYATATDGTAYWRCWSNDGSGGGTVTATTVAVASNTAYTFRVDVVSTSEIRYYIAGTLVATHTTNLPGATTDLIPRCTVRTLNAAIKSVRWAWFHVRHS